MIKSGINQIGGKFRLRKDLEQFTPYHKEKDLEKFNQTNLEKFIKIVKKIKRSD